MFLLYLFYVFIPGFLFEVSGLLIHTHMFKYPDWKRKICQILDLIMRFDLALQYMMCDFTPQMFTHALNHTGALMWKKSTLQKADICKQDKKLTFNWLMTQDSDKIINLQNQFDFIHGNNVFFNADIYLFTMSPSLPSDEVYAVFRVGHIQKSPWLSRSFPCLCIQWDSEVFQSWFL